MAVKLSHSLAQPGSVIKQYILCYSSQCFKKFLIKMAQVWKTRSFFSNRSGPWWTSCSLTFAGFASQLCPLCRPWPLSGLLSDLCTGRSALPRCSSWTWPSGTRCCSLTSPCCQDTSWLSGSETPQQLMMTSGNDQAYKINWSLLLGRKEKGSFILKPFKK